MSNLGHSESIFEVTEEADGGYATKCLTENIFTQGDTWKELRANVKDAVAVYVFDALEPLTDADLTRTVTIRTEPHSVMQAINRQVAHYSYHVGQIVYLARHVAGDKWQTLTIPKKKSAEFNARVAAGEISQR